MMPGSHTFRSYFKTMGLNVPKYATLWSLGNIAPLKITVPPVEHPEGSYT